MTRYDERMLSSTKVSFMYAPGSAPVTFEINGVTFGCALGIETHFPELFLEYERLGVDCMLFSTTNVTSSFAAETLGHASSNQYWVSFAAHARTANAAPSGIAAPDGGWAARCADKGLPSIAVADVGDTAGNPARPWRRTARTGIYERYRVESDPRSKRRNAF